MNKSSLKINKKYIAAAWPVAIFFILDRFLKVLSFSYFTNHSFSIFKWLNFSFSANYFISFSIPLGGFFLIILLLILISLLIFWLIKSYQERSNFLLTISLAIIIFGACSNLLDRLVYGFVIDYLHLFNLTILNLADIAISGGAILAIISLSNKFDKKV